MNIYFVIPHISESSNIEILENNVYLEEKQKYTIKGAKYKKSKLCTTTGSDSVHLVTLMVKETFLLYTDDPHWSNYEHIVTWTNTDLTSAIYIKAHSSGLQIMETKRSSCN